MTQPPRPTREQELERIRETYRGYDRERSALWDPGNPGFARIMRERDDRLVTLLRDALPGMAGSVLDLGCGTGELATFAHAAGIAADWTGVDLREEVVAHAIEAIPWAHFLVASADALPLADSSFDAVVASTLFSSLPTPELEVAVAGEIARVLRPGGSLVWYDLRYDSPANPAVHRLSARRVGELFPGWPATLRSFTLIPPLARRLGKATSMLYPALHAVPPLRSHLVGSLRKPTRSYQKGQEASASRRRGQVGRAAAATK